MTNNLNSSCFSLSHLQIPYLKNYQDLLLLIFAFLYFLTLKEPCYHKKSLFHFLNVLYILHRKNSLFLQNPNSHVQYDIVGVLLTKLVFYLIYLPNI